MKTLNIGNRGIGTGKPVFVIAEIGINHNGDIELAKKMIDAAQKAGASAVKFQTHIPEKEMLKNGFSAGYVGESLFDLLKRVELSKNDHLILKEHAEKNCIIFLSTPFSREAADMLGEIGVHAFKVGSGELTNIPLLKHIASKGKPMIISTGMSNLEEIRETIEELKKINPKIVILHCTSDYPTKYENVNLKVIETLQREFELPVGLSDHSAGIYTALAAVALGACVIEKHFTLDRSLPGPDQSASINPTELEELVKGVKAVEKALGEEKKVTETEKEVQKMARESVVAVKEIRKGEKIDEDSVWVKRPGIGIPAKELEKVIGKIAVRDIKKDSLIKWDDLE
ncbi:MAG: N-acetylneuraminate synthase [Candidatus Diapherotrites archaeon]|nr:N-acetylneuraminate synthase [Candidatus Diapherotrites archaeon]